MNPKAFGVSSELKKMSYEKKKKLRKYVRQITKLLSPFLSLKTLALINGTDKLAHGYIPHYHSHFKSMRNHRLKILEIGVGGYDNPHVGGESLRMWSDYFRKSKVYSIDINDKSPQEEKRIKIFTGSQNDRDFLQNLALQEGPFDIIIDDGSHISEHVITSFNILFNYLNDGGIYVVEDLHTSYWPQFHGWMGEKDKQASVEFFKTLIDSINFKYIPNPSQILYKHQLKTMSFYEKMIFIKKGASQNTLFPYMKDEIKKAEEMTHQ